MSDESLRAAVARFHGPRGASGDAATAPTIFVTVFGVTCEVPNPPFQRELLARHDLHHILTGYGTDWAGEAELGAWELGTGPTHWFVWLSNLAATFGLGLRYPRRTWRAFVAGRSARSLYRDPTAYEALLELRVRDLRERLRVPGRSSAARPMW